MFDFCTLIYIKAGGCGLNLVGANRLFMFDPDWNPATDLQAMARIYRQGQKRRCFIYRMFSAGTVEEVILQRQVLKGGLAETIDTASTKKLSFTNEELKDCFTLKKMQVGQCDTKNKLGSSWADFDGAIFMCDGDCNDEILGEVVLQNSENEYFTYVHILSESSFIVRGEQDSANHIEYGSSIDKQESSECEFDEDI